MNIAIITGASSGLGKEFLYQANKWAKVDEIWVISRNEKALNDLKLITNFKLRIIPLDLTKEASFDKYIELLKKEDPNVKLFINNAGYGKFGDFDKIDIKDDFGMIDLNIKAVVALTRYTIPYLKDGSKLLLVSSRASFQPVPYMATYAASKSFVRSYAESLYYELKPKGIRIMALCPTYVNTKFLLRAATEQNDRIYNYGKIYEPNVIVKRAYFELYRRKNLISTYGFNTKFTKFLIRFLPDKLIMKSFIRSQRKKEKINK